MRPTDYEQSCASDVLRPEDIRRHRQLVEELAAIGGRVAYATHDELHFEVPEDRTAEGRARVRGT